MGKDSGTLAGRLQEQLSQYGLEAFLDENEKDGIQTADHWPARLWMAVSTCSVCIVLVSPGFFLRPWPVHELQLALQRPHVPEITVAATDADTERADQQRRSARPADSPAPVTIIPVYCSPPQLQAQPWNRAAASAAVAAVGNWRRRGLRYREPGGGAVWPAFAGQLSADTVLDLLRQLSALQEPTAERAYKEHFKQKAILVEQEIVRTVLRILPPPFRDPTCESPMHTAAHVLANQPSLTVVPDCRHGGQGAHGTSHIPTPAGG